MVTKILFFVELTSLTLVNSSGVKIKVISFIPLIKDENLALTIDPCL
jgi:hypothetical protein